MSDAANNDKSDLHVSKMRRLFWATFIVPCVVVVALGIFAYNMALRVNELEKITEDINNVTNQVNLIQEFLITERYLEKSSNFAWARQKFEQMSKDAGHYLIYNRLGGLYVSYSKYNQAETVLRKAIELKRDNWQAYSTLAYLFYANGNLEAAIEAGEKSIDINPLNADAYNTLAWIYANSDNEELYDKAVNYAEEAAELTRYKNTHILDTLATVYMKNEDYNAALKSIQMAIEISDPDARLTEKKREIEEELKQAANGE